jgi:hypothetical protein
MLDSDIDEEFMELRETQRFIDAIKEMVIEEVGPGKPGEVIRRTNEVIDGYVAFRNSDDPFEQHIAAMIEASARKVMGPPPNYEADEAYAFLDPSRL